MTKQTVVAMLLKVGSEDYAPADGKSVVSAWLGAYFDAAFGSGAVGVQLKLDVLAQDPGDLQFWWDMDRTAPITGNVLTIGQEVPGITGPGWADRIIYISST